MLFIGTAVTDLLTDVLTLDKMEQGQFELDLKPTCLDCLVRSTARLFIPTAEALGLAFEIVIEDSDVPMQAKDYLSSEHGTTNANGNDNDTKDEHVSAPSTEQKSSPSQLSSGSRRKLRDGYDRSSLSSLLTLPSPSPTNRTLQTVRSSSGSACVHPFSYKVLVDPTRLRQILRNLLSNAFKFTKRGTVQIELWCSDGSALISVADTGIGIDEAAQERLFRPYVQFANEMQQGQGSGLGLSISKRLTLLHGGDLTCKSEAGLGSTFTVQIPLIAATSETRPSPSITSRAINRGTSSPTDTAVVPTSTARLMDACARSLDRLHSEGSIEMQSPIAQNIRRFVDARLTAAALPTVKPAATTTPPSTDDALSPPRPTSENTPAAASHPSIDTASSAQKRALVVDDSVLNVKLLCRLLELRGWSAIGAEDGAVACELVDDRSTEHAFHVIFMDRNMPVMDGLQATRELRARGFSGCIIGLTGDVSTESVRELNSAGVDLVMPKPFDVKKLDEVLQQLSLPTA